MHPSQFTSKISDLQSNKCSIQNNFSRCPFLSGKRPKNEQKRAPDRNAFFSYSLCWNVLAPFLGCVHLKGLFFTLWICFWKNFWCILFVPCSSCKPKVMYLYMCCWCFLTSWLSSCREMGTHVQMKNIWPTSKRIHFLKILIIHLSIHFSIYYIYIYIYFFIYIFIYIPDRFVAETLAWNNKN